MNLIVDPGALFTIIAIVAGLTIMLFLRSRHVERMLQLQLGLPIDEQSGDNFALKLGSLSIGIGVGILVAYVLEYLLSRSTEELYPALMFLFGGLGLVISYVIIRSVKEKV